MVVLPLTSAQFVRAQGATDSAAAADTTMAGVDSLPPLPSLWRFNPSYLGTINGDVTAVSMANSFTGAFVGPNLLLGNVQIKIDEKHYRGQNRRELNKNMSALVNKTFSPEFNTSLSLKDSRRFSRVVSTSGALQDFVLNDKSTTGIADYQSTLGGGFSYDATTTLLGSVSQKTFKDDQTISGRVNGGVRWVSPGGRVAVSGRGMRGEVDETSTTILRTFNGLGATSDSLFSDVIVSVTDSIVVGVDYLSYGSEREFADQARGALGAQQAGAENVLREREVKDSKNVGVFLESGILSSIDVSVSARHNEQVTRYDVQSTRNSNTTTDEMVGAVKYTTPWKTGVALNLENTITKRDLAPNEVNSYDETRKKVSLAFYHPFRQGFSIRLTLSNSLSRSEYVFFEENPRDRDQIDAQVSALIVSNPFEKFSATISLAATNTEFVNISATQSGDNRTREIYDFKPSFTYRFSPYLNIEQRYGLSIEFTDFTYSGEDNFLDRNITFQNIFRTTPMRDVTFRLTYDLQLHDAGSYLFRGNNIDRTLVVEREDRRDRISLGTEYKINDHLKAQLDYDYSRRTDTTVSTGREVVRDDGEIIGGFVGDYKWSDQRTLSFVVKRAKRFSPFATEEQKDYWVMQSSFKYAF